MKKLPIGRDLFKDIIEKGFYYVDKTKMIEELLERGSYVTLFPRPRRFGKSLMISTEVKKCMMDINSEIRKYIIPGVF